MKKLLIPMLFMFTCTVNAGGYMTEEEIKGLFTNKTFDIHNVQKDKHLKAYDGSDGEHIVYIPWKDKISNRKWWTDGNHHCTSSPKRDDRCKKMKDMGDGSYQGFADGQHVVTLSNFRDGNEVE